MDEPTQDGDFDVAYAPSQFNNFLRGACSQNCTPAVLSTASASVSSGCSTDLASASPIATVLSTLVSPTGYGNVKGVVCLQATANSTFCITKYAPQIHRIIAVRSSSSPPRSLLTSVQTSTGQDITVDTVTGLITGNTLVSTLNALPASQLCTDCAKGLVTNVRALVPANLTTTVNSAVSGKCGAAFVDGRLPAGVAAASATNSTGSGAVTSTPLSAGESLKVQKLLAGIAIGSALAGYLL